MSLRTAFLVLCAGVISCVVSVLSMYEQQPLTSMQGLVALADVDSLSVSIGGMRKDVFAQYRIEKNSGKWKIHWNALEAKLSSAAVSQLQELWSMNLFNVVSGSSSDSIKSEVKSSKPGVVTTNPEKAFVQIKTGSASYRVSFDEQSTVLGAWHGNIEFPNGTVKAGVFGDLLVRFFAKDPAALIENSVLCGMAIKKIDRFSVTWPSSQKDSYELIRTEGSWKSKKGGAIDAEQMSFVLKQLSKPHKLDAEKMTGNETNSKLFDLNIANSAESGSACRVTGERILKKKDDSLSEVLRFSREGESAGWLFGKDFSLDMLSIGNLIDVFPLREAVKSPSEFIIRFGSNEYQLTRVESGWSLGEQAVDELFFTAWLSALKGLQSIGDSRSARFVSGELLGQLTAVSDTERETFKVRRGMMVEAAGGNSEVAVVECSRASCPFLIETSAIKRLLPNQEVFLPTSGIM
jgi:hypothetical protein